MVILLNSLSSPITVNFWSHTLFRALLTQNISNFDFIVPSQNRSPTCLQNSNAFSTDVSCAPRRKSTSGAETIIRVCSFESSHPNNQSSQDSSTNIFLQKFFIPWAFFTNNSASYIHVIQMKVVNYLCLVQ